MNKRRLLKLAELLEADAKNKKGIKFNLNVVSKKVGGKLFKAGEKPAVNCGTQACAIGLWALSGQFPGVQAVILDGGSSLWPKYQGKTGRKAAERYFGITDVQSANLFLPQYYDVTRGARAERAVAKRIRELVSAVSN